jgi:hypothetical protein
MILVITRMKVIPGKRFELLQTFASLSGFIRMEGDTNATTSVKVSRMKIDSFFLNNGIPWKTLWHTRSRSISIAECSRGQQCVFLLMLVLKFRHLLN